MFVVEICLGILRDKTMKEKLIYVLPFVVLLCSGKIYICRMANNSEILRDKTIGDKLLNIHTK